MPIYEYTCRKCRAHVEILQKVSDKPLVKCKKCGGRLEKEWSRTGFQFKGTGWYVTDYAGKKSDAKEEAGGGAAEAKSETPAAAAESPKPEKPAGGKKTPRAGAASKGAGKD